MSGFPFYPIPRPPADPRQEEWERPKTWKEWKRFYETPQPFVEILRQSMTDVQYMAKADLYYIDAGLLQKPDAQTLMSIEYVSEHLQEDHRLIAGSAHRDGIADGWTAGRGFRLWNPQSRGRGRVTGRFDAWSVPGL